MLCCNCSWNFNFYCCPWFLSFFDAFFSNPKLTVFSLYDTFFRCWVKKEHTRKTSYLSEREIRESLWGISNKLYYNQSCEIKYDDTAIIDLLSFSTLGDGLTEAKFGKEGIEGIVKYGNGFLVAGGKRHVIYNITPKTNN